MNKEKAVVVVSGGMDSVTLLHKISKKFEVYALTLDYGQRHIREIESAEYQARQIGCQHLSCDISGILGLISNSALTSGKIDVPEGHYEDDNMKLTVVPNRNMILISLAIAYGINIGANDIFYGAHAGDHAIYPDCRKEFVEAMKSAALLCSYDPINIHAPYLDMDKISILKEGIGLGVDYSMTWTCYKGHSKACGRCGSCRERLEAFAINGIVDPLPYKEVLK